MVAVVSVPSEIANAVGDRVCVAVGIKSYELGEGASGLQSDDAAQGEVTKESVVRSRGREVRNETLAYVLVRIRAFQRAIVEVLGRAHERGEGTVVKRVREGIVRVEVENLVKPLDQLQRHTVVNGVPGVICVIKQTGIVICRTASGTRGAKICFTGGPARRGWWRRNAARNAGTNFGNSRIRRCAERRADVQVFRSHEMMCHDPH